MSKPAEDDARRRVSSGLTTTGLCAAPAAVLAVSGWKRLGEGVRTAAEAATG